MVVRTKDELLSNIRRDIASNSAGNVSPTDVRENLVDTVDTLSGSASIADDSVSTDKLQNNSVTEVKISNASVTTDKIADSSVVGSKIADNTLISSKFQEQSVNNREIANNAVTGNKISNSTISTDKLQDSSVTQNKLAINSVSGDKIVDGAISHRTLGVNSITERNIADNSISTDNLRDRSITGDKLRNSSITEDKISNNSISTDKIQDSAVTGNKLANNSVRSDKIANDVNLLDLIPDGTIVGDKLANNSVRSDKIVNGAVDFDKIAESPTSSPGMMSYDFFGDPGFLPVGNSSQILQVVGGILGFGKTPSRIPDILFFRSESTGGVVFNWTFPAGENYDAIFIISGAGGGGGDARGRVIPPATVPADGRSGESTRVTLGGIFEISAPGGIGGKSSVSNGGSTSPRIHPSNGIALGAIGAQGGTSAFDGTAGQNGNVQVVVERNIPPETTLNLRLGIGGQEALIPGSPISRSGAGEGGFGYVIVIYGPSAT